MSFYGWSPDFVDKRITGAQGWVYYAWAQANRVSAFSENRTIEKGYHWQEVQRILRNK